MVNKVTLVGYLGKDPELRRLEGGVGVAKFSIATSESFLNREGTVQEQTEWHDVVLWRKLADRAEQQLRKGMLVYLEGKLSTRRWQDKQGDHHKSTEIVGSYLRILTRPTTDPGTVHEDPSRDLPAVPGAGADELIDFLTRPAAGRVEE